MTRLYLRIWLAVVAALLVSTVGVGAIIRAYYENQLQEQRAAAAQAMPWREVSLRAANGDLLGTGLGQARRYPGGGVQYQLNLTDGREISVVLGPRVRGGAPGGAPQEPFAQGNMARDAQRDGRMPPLAGAPWYFLRGGPGLLVLALTLCVAVALGAYPVIRRMTLRLEALKQGVQRFGDGDLSVRVPVAGKDEVAYLTAQFNQSAARIEALLASHKTMLANASHELRSPLTRLRMGLEMVQVQPTPSLYAEMQRSIRELDELIEEVLLASRLDAHATSGVATETVDVLGLLAEECSRVGASLHVDSAHGSDLTGDAKLIRRLIRNLLENARRYGGRGEISAEWRSKVLRVTDHGPGVPVSQRERIFEPFYRLPGASESSGGVGLGLALVRSIARHHGAQVVCVDRPDGLAGACFEVRFPAA